MLLQCLIKAMKSKYLENAQVIKSLLKCVSFCGKQGLSLRGHRDDSTASDASNKGNFIELVRFRAENDDFLTVKLQKKSSDILAAYEHVSEVIRDLELLKTNCEEEFHFEIKTLADELNIPIAIPRIAAETLS